MIENVIEVLINIFATLSQAQYLPKIKHKKNLCWINEIMKGFSFKCKLLAYKFYLGALKMYINILNNWLSLLWLQYFFILQARWNVSIILATLKAETGVVNKFRSSHIVSYENPTSVKFLSRSRGPPHCLQRGRAEEVRNRAGQ